MNSENKMGVMPVGRLIISISLPMMISMIVQALYNVVDSIFVSWYDPAALTAVSLTFPYQNLMIAFATGTGVGINALLSRNLGEKKIDAANRVAMHGIVLSLITGAVFAVAGVSVADLFFKAQGATGKVLEYGREYMWICSGFGLALFGQIVFERLLQSTGKTFYSMITQGAGAIINIILDPIFIFGFGGIPAMGAAGAAIATVVGQLVAMVLGLIFNIKKNKEITLRFKGFRFEKTIVKRIYLVGIPSIMVASIGSVMTFGMNKIFSAFRGIGNDAINVFGVYFKLQSFAFMPLFGLNNSMIPIIAYNFGARKRDRIVSTIKYSVMYAEIIMISFMVIMLLFPLQLLGMFNASPEMLKIGTVALRTISISYAAAAFCIISTSVFQAVGHAFLSMIVSLVRQLCVLLPIAYIIAKVTGDINMVWLSFPIAEVFSLTLCIIFLRHVYKKEFKDL